MQRRTNAFEMKCYRTLLRIPYTAHVTNDSIKEKLTQKIGNVEMLISIIRKRQLKWFGHVTRHDDTLPLPTINCTAEHKERGVGADQGCHGYRTSKTTPD